MAVVKFSKQTIQPNPIEVDYWVDIKTDPYGSVWKYYNGTDWVALNLGDGSGGGLPAFNYYTKTQINEMLNKKADIEFVESKVDDAEFAKVIQNIEFREIGDNSMELVMLKYDGIIVGVTVPIATETNAGMVAGKDFKNFVKQYQLQQLYTEMYDIVKEIREQYQPRLKAGQNIIIDQTTNTISATGELSVDWDSIPNVPEHLVQSISTEDEVINVDETFTTQVLRKNEQTLTEEEKAQVRSNIGEDRINEGGMNYVVLRKDLSFAEQLTQTNTIYEIRYDFYLNGEEVTIPEGCILKFEGGKLKDGILRCNNTYVDGLIDCLSQISLIKGNIINNIKLSWLGIYGQNDKNVFNLKKIQDFSINALEVDSDISFSEGDIELPEHTVIIGNGYKFVFESDSATKAMLILSQGCQLHNLSILCASINFNGVVVLADTEVNKAHTFRLNGVNISGQWNSDSNYLATGLKLKASNYQDNIENYITGCSIRDLRITWVKIGIDISCANMNDESSKSFAWLNEVYVSGLYVSAVERGLKTSFIDNGINNKADSVGPLYFNQFEFQALDKSAMMFEHVGEWGLNLNIGFSYDCDYKGLLDKGRVYSFGIYGGYKADGRYTDEDGFMYGLIDSVKIYNEGTYMKLDNLKTMDTYRHGDFDPYSGTKYWSVGCDGSSFAFKEGGGYVARSFESPSNYSFAEHIKTAGPDINKMIYYNVGGGCVELIYSKRYGINHDEYVILDNKYDAYRPINILTNIGNGEIVSFGQSEDLIKGEIYKGRLKVIFKDKTYEEYKSDYDFLSTLTEPIKSIYMMKNVSSRFVEEDGNLFIEWEAECLKTIYYITFLLEFMYKRKIPSDSSFVSEFEGKPIIKIPVEVYINNLELVYIERVSKNGSSSARPSNVEIGFRFFDTTINKPIWWTGTAWVDANGINVDETITETTE